MMVFSGSIRAGAMVGFTCGALLGVCVLSGFINEKYFSFLIL